MSKHLLSLLLKIQLMNTLASPNTAHIYSKGIHQGVANQTFDSQKIFYGDFHNALRDCTQKSVRAHDLK